MEIRNRIPSCAKVRVDTEIIMKNMLAIARGGTNL